MQIILHWRLIEEDLHQVYGIDTGDLVLMRTRSWRWLQIRIAGLLNLPPIYLPDGKSVPATRLGWELNPPNFDDRPTE